MLTDGSQRWFPAPAIRFFFKGALRKSQTDYAASSTFENNPAAGSQQEETTEAGLSFRKVFCVRDRFSRRARTGTIVRKHVNCGCQSWRRAALAGSTQRRELSQSAIDAMRPEGEGRLQSPSAPIEFQRALKQLIVYSVAGPEWFINNPGLFIDGFCGRPASRHLAILRMLRVYRTFSYFA
jgi:hypothetical protein